MAAGDGIYYTGGTANAEIKLLNCAIKGEINDIKQTSAANTVRWNIQGCSFSKASININGNASFTGQAGAANNAVYAPIGANLFGRTTE
jgi:hypothetical protein